jgi:hypothetical protein
MRKPRGYPLSHEGKSVPLGDQHHNQFPNTSCTDICGTNLLIKPFTTPTLNFSKMPFMQSNKLCQDLFISTPLNFRATLDE